MKTIKNLLTLIGCALFVAYNIWLLLSDDALPGIMVFICWLSIIFFGGGGLFAGYVIFGPKKAAPVDWNQQCLIVGYGLYHCEIEWKHITGFSMIEYNNIDFVMVHVDNEDEVIANTKGWFKRWGLKLNLQQMGGIYAIRAVNLTVTPQQLCEQLESELKKRNG